MESKLSPRLMYLAAQLAERHRIPETDIVHPKVLVMSGDGTIDTFMTAKLREPHYIPYCLKIDCGRVRRTAWGFQCPTCGNKMNYNLRHFDGNQNVVYDGDAPPILSIKEWNTQVVARSQAKQEKKVSEWK